MSKRRIALALCPLLLAVAPEAKAGEPVSGYHPWAGDHFHPLEIDVREAAAHPEKYRTGTRADSQPQFHRLDEIAAQAAASSDGAQPGPVDEAWVQRGTVVLPAPVANGDVEVDPRVAHGMQVVPGNEYPRKHTLFLNFNGGMLYTGTDNSAENRSSLADQGVYPTYEGGEQKALSIIQAVQEDVANYGINVVYLERPNKTVPYTMEMIGGQWEDTNTDSPSGGVAPGADCGALGQRHVVYTFASGGQGATQAANTASQEAGHAWGLDHTFNCGSVMSYCGSGNGGFSTQCDTLCESQCQGPNSAGCRLTHEEFCGVGNDQQNEDAELSWIFGGNEPDMEPPEVVIVEPADGIQLDAPADVDIRSQISDNYGGYGWYYVVTRDGEEILNFVDYDRQVDLNYLPALNLTGLDDGEWVFTVGAEDHFGHITEASVTVYVGDVAPGGLDESGGGGMETGGMGTAGDVGTGDSGVAPGMDDDGTGKACACRASSWSSGGGAATLLGLMLLGLGRPRRRRARVAARPDRRR